MRKKSKFEFGYDENDTLILGDEIFTPDSSRFWSLADYQVGVSPKSYDNKKPVKQKGISAEFGAREIERVIQGQIKPLLVDKILFGVLKDGGKCRLTVEGDSFLSYHPLRHRRKIYQSFIETKMEFCLLVWIDFGWM